MRLRLLLGLLLCLSTAAFATSDSVQTTHVFAHQVGTASLNVLRLFDNGTYEYCRYTKKKSTRDAGEFVIHHKRLVLKSTLKKHGPNPMLRKKMFITPKGLFESRMNALFGKKSIMDESPDAELAQAWPYNPMIDMNVDAAGKPAPVVAQLPSPATPNQLNTTELAKRGAFIKTYYLALNNHYAPGFNDMLISSYTGPDTYITTVNGQPAPFVGDTSSNALFGEYETVIHESVHHYNANTYFITPTIQIPVERTEVFPSAEFASIVPSDASKNIFRYDTYVGKDSKVSANVSGIYGLLDEYSAYHAGAHACLLAALKALSEKDTVKARAFLSQASGTYYAHYEFRLFTAWYLHYASESHPEMYANFMDNKNLRVAFTLLDQDFKQTILELQKVAVKTGYSGSMFDASYYDAKAQKDYCGKQLVKEEKYLNAFKVKDCNQSNYKKFLAVSK